MDKKNDDLASQLHNPNDDSFGECYAPQENGQVIEAKKKHFRVDQEVPANWVQVPCSSQCNR